MKTKQRKLYQLYWVSINGVKIMPIQFSFNKKELDEMCKILNSSDKRLGDEYCVACVNDPNDMFSKDRTF